MKQRRLNNPRLPALLLLPLALAAGRFAGAKTPKEISRATMPGSSR